MEFLTARWTGHVLSTGVKAGARLGVGASREHTAAAFAESATAPGSGRVSLLRIEPWPGARAKDQQTVPARTRPQRTCVETGGLEAKDEQIFPVSTRLRAPRRAHAVGLLLGIWAALLVVLAPRSALASGALATLVPEVAKSLGTPPP